jgi:hypothetical protein
MANERATSESPMSDEPAQRRSLWSRAHLFQDVDPEAATWPMVAYCFMTGWMYVPYHFLPPSSFGEGYRWASR